VLGLLDETFSASAIDGYPAPIVMLVVTPAMLGEPSPERLCRALQRALGPHPYARLLCTMVTVPVSDGVSGRGLARLRVWARSLGLPGRAVACRVLVAADAVQALLACAEEHFVNEIVLLAPLAAATALEMTREMAAQLALSAPCSVQLVRA
jgi:hypothetical protein